MSISLNSVTPTQPTTVQEGLLQVQHDNVAIDMSRQRNRLGQKKWAMLQWDWLSPADYQTIIALLTTGSGLSYNNSASNYSGGTFVFTGLPDQPEESEYLIGSSLYRKIKTTIRET
jgi:hypothetical protein